MSEKLPPVTSRFPRVLPGNFVNSFPVQLGKLPRHAEVRRLLADGATLDDAVRFVREELQAFPSMTDEALKRHLAEYRKSIPVWELKDQIGKITAEAVQDDVLTRLDEVGELEKLTRLQLRRIEGGIAYEEKLKGLLSPEVGKQVAIAADLLVRSAELKKELGIYNTGAPKDGESSTVVNADGTSTSQVHYASPEIGRVMGSPESRRKVLQVAEKIAALGGKRGLFMQQLLAGASATPEPAAADRAVHEAPADAPKVGG